MSDIRSITVHKNTPPDERRCDETLVSAMSRQVPVCVPAADGNI